MRRPFRTEIASTIKFWHLDDHRYKTVMSTPGDMLAGVVLAGDQKSIGA